jgi:hypothetical protein
MANPLTNGQPSGKGETSTSPPQTWDAQQTAILDAEMRQQAAAQQAVEAANQRAKRRPATNGMQNPGIQATYNAHGTPALGVPKAKGKRGK